MISEAIRLTSVISLAARSPANPCAYTAEHAA